MSNDKMREAFEKSTNIKTGVSFKGERYTSPYRADADHIYTLNRDWQIFQNAWQAAQAPPALVELVESITDRIYDWARCGMATNGHSGKPKETAELVRFRDAIMVARAVARPSIAETPKVEAASDTGLEPCPFCGNPATEIMGLIGCEPCAIARRDAASWNRRSAPSIAEKRVCEWTYEPGDWGTFKTGCGKKFVLALEYGGDMDWMGFCPFCGEIWDCEEAQS